jgi:hypothetical protein
MKALFILFFLAIANCSMFSTYAEDGFVPDFGSDEDLKFLSFLADETTQASETPAASTTTPTGSGTTPSKMSTLESLTKTFFSIQSKWGEIVNTFKTTRSNTVKSYTEGKGFDYFASNTTTQVLKGVSEENFEKKLIPSLLRRFQVPDELKLTLEGVLMESMWGESNKWQSTESLFSTGETGKCNFITIMAAKNDAGKMDVVYADVKSQLKFSPNVMVVTKSISVLGGIWQDTKDVVQTKPREITMEMMTSVQDFLKMIAFQGIASQFGVKLELPTI